MITSSSLETALRQIFFGEETGYYKYVVPIRGGFFAPTVNREANDHVSTWIGYRILSMDPRTRLIKSPEDVLKQIRVDFRITALGPNAEEFIQSTLLWEDRADVQTLFENMEAQIMYDRRYVYTRPLAQEGLGDDLLWVTDMHAMTFIRQKVTTIPWFNV